MDVQLETEISISARKLADSMSATELADFCSELAEKLDREFSLRNIAAENFADGLSENGCRFLAEVITQHYHRNRSS